MPLLSYGVATRSPVLRSGIVLPGSEQGVSGRCCVCRCALCLRYAMSGTPIPYCLWSAVCCTEVHRAIRDLRTQSQYAMRGTLTARVMS
eukprot:3315869-Rhodomonas_salina.3